ncbi:flagellar basal body rod protein FlgC [candidate division KSB1 bacterium]|nr:MAG: flagellar basal body rod protein FlgC [candidate division KSB1 bacterium]
MTIRGLFSAIDISATGLTAQRTKMNAIASNIANKDATRTEKGGPYRRKQVIFRPGERAEFLTILKKEHLKLKRTTKTHLDNEETWVKRENIFQGVKVDKIAEDTRPPRLVYDPDHPDADENGFVAYPNIDIVTEMVNMIAASRAYEANVTAMNASKGMMMNALEI